MLEQLRIQCPSCGIVLDVRNSKHEAIKRITCPNCHKQLAVDFQEEEKPEIPLKPLEALYYGEMRIDLQEGTNQIPLPACDALEIKVVRLKDGNSKCLVHALNDEPAVLVNEEALGKEDEVALSIGDEIKIGETILTYGQQGKVLPSQPPTPPAPKTPKHRRWPYVVIALAAIVVCMFAVKHFNTKKVENPLVEVADTPTSKHIENNDPPSNPPTEERRRVKKVEEEVVKEVDYTKLSQYDLVQLANKDDARAQYELGKRYVKGEGSNTVVLGINYLKEASRNGLSEAQGTLINVINRLQRKADNGDSIAYQILMSIDNQ
jgi:ssDNA-binding Zn-finger/Zn-ribbon topoisomerase 1